MYFPSSEDKDADQLRGYREADLRLCFRICSLLVFPWGGSYLGRILIFFSSLQTQSKFSCEVALVIYSGLRL